MKQPDISNYCVDALRSFFTNTYGIKLKSGHAHEIVAAFFGFKSRISMLEDKKDTLREWEQGDFVLLAPPISLIDQRLQNLLDLPSQLPASPVLAETVYSVLVAQLYLNRRLRTFIISGRLPINWEMNVSTEHNDNGSVFTVNVGYRTITNEYLRDSRYVIHLTRIAANPGYGDPSVRETTFTGLRRKYSDEDLGKLFPK
jgi:hypothetical protein